MSSSEQLSRPRAPDMRSHALQSRNPPRLRRSPVPRARQRGIALLVAILLVALGTIIAAAIGYENAMAARRSVATFAFDQELLVSQGAEALAAYGLYQSKKQNSPSVNFTQPWATPLPPTEIVPDVMLDASLEDVSGRFNINRLVNDDANGSVNAVAREAFINLLQSLDLEPKWADYIIDWIDPNIQPMPDGAEDSTYLGQDPPYLVANRFITSTSELLALPEFGRERYLKLAPYITALPPNVVVNVCTAPGKVLDAFMTGQSTFSVNDGEPLAKNRAAAHGCFPDLNTDYKSAFDSPDNFTKVQAELSTNSSYFRLTSHITIGTTEFNLYSLLFQDANLGLVRPIQRSFSSD